LRKRDGYNEKRGAHVLVKNMGKKKKDGQGGWPLSREKRKRGVGGGGEKSTRRKGEGKQKAGDDQAKER